MTRTSPYVFILPVLALTVLVFFYPLANVFIFSFYRMGFVGRKMFVGLHNYRYFLKPEFHQMLLRTIMYLFGSVPLCIILGFLAALLFNQEFPGSKMMRSLFFIPWLIPSAIVAIMWRWTLHPGYGLVNNVLLALGIIDEGISFFTYDKAIFSVIAVRIWRGTPFAYICILAGLQSVPHQVKEAAVLDGASSMQQLLWITIPLIRSVILVVTVMLTIWTVILFDQVFVLTGGGPLDATRIFTIDIYYKAFFQHRVGLAYVVSVAGIAFLMGLSFVYARMMQSKT